jgi:DNA-binding transcriptional LysR family regulator
MESIPFASLAALDALVRTGSLAAAAQELHLTSPAVHKQLKQLESALGLRLYEKVGRGLSLTEAAKLIFPFAQASLAQIAAARRAAEEWRGLRRGTVRVGSGVTLSSHWLPQVLSVFRSANPGVDVTVDTGSTLELCEQLRAGLIDLAFVIEEKNKPQPMLKAIGRWPSRAFVVSGEESLRGIRRLDQLKSKAYFGYRAGTRFASIMDHYFQRHRFLPTFVTRCDNPDSLLQMLGAGYGFAVLPEWILTRPPLFGKVWLLETREKPPQLHVEVLRSQAQPLSPAALAFALSARSIRLPQLSPAFEACPQARTDVDVPSRGASGKRGSIPSSL